MTPSQSSRTEKDKVWKNIETLVGNAKIHSLRRTDWRETIANNTCIFVTFSEIDQRGYSFYDLKQDDLEVWLNHEKAFVVFVVGTSECALIVPVSTICQQLTENHRSTDRSRNFKFHITQKHDTFVFSELPYFDTHPYLNNYSQLTEHKYNLKATESRAKYSVMPANQKIRASGKSKAAEVKAIVVADLKSFKLEEEYFEGRHAQRLTNYYERSPKLRAAAILAHGTTCMACGFDFEKMYGEHGTGYIEVHHLKPVSDLKKETKVDPKTEMAVVCSNCHRMIHRKRDKVLSLEELKLLLEKR